MCVWDVWSVCGFSTCKVQYSVSSEVTLQQVTSDSAKEARHIVQLHLTKTWIYINSLLIHCPYSVATLLDLV